MFWSQILTYELLLVMLYHSFYSYRHHIILLVSLLFLLLSQVMIGLNDYMYDSFFMPQK